MTDEYHVTHTNGLGWMRSSSLLLAICAAQSRHRVLNLLREDVTPDEHLLDGGVRDVWTGGAGGEFGHAVLKLADGALPFGVGGRYVAEEGVERVNEGRRSGEVGVEGEGIILEQEGAARGLDQDVVAGVAEGEFLAGFLGEIVVAVFGFPEAMGEAEVIEQRAVHVERVLARAADFPLGDEGPVVLAGAVVEQALESGADGGLMGDAEVVELAQGGVVILDRLVGRFEIERPHGEGSTPKPGRLSAKLHERCSAASGLKVGSGLRKLG